MTERALRLLDLAITVAILVAGVVLFFLLPWSTRGWVVPVAIGANLLNTLVFILLRRHVRTSKRSATTGLPAGM
jgi:hypothetical protein